MNKQKIYQEIDEKLGVTPVFFRELPEATLDQEWQLFKYTDIQEGPIPHKYRHLIGLGVAAAIKCRYCLFYHTELAKLHGASEAELKDALYQTKCTTGWSNYITGMQTDIDQFKKEVTQACNHIRQGQLAKV